MDIKPLNPLDPVSEPPPPIVHVSWLSPEEADTWAVIEATIDLIAAHYRIDRDLVSGAVIDLEVEMCRDTGLRYFGRLLERPWGVTSLGLAVADALLGDEARTLKPLRLSYH